MDKLKTLASRKYIILSCHRFFIFNGHKENNQSLILNVTNDGGSICFTFTNLATNEITSFDNPTSGEYIVPLNKGEKIKLVINASKAIGSYKIQIKNN